MVKFTNMRYTLLFLFSFAYGQMYPVGNHFMNEPIVKHSHITLQYNTKHKQARWVHYKLDNSMLRNECSRTQANFALDPVIKYTATNADYKGSGYDKGHLCPANDMEFNITALRECFYFTNIAPQTHSCNAGEWKEIETLVHKWAQYDTLIVCTGTLVNDRCKKIGRNKVSIPTHFWKCVYSVKNKVCIAFLVMNNTQHLPINMYVVTVDELEMLTDLDFFSELPDEIEKSIEAKTNEKAFLE